MIDQSDSASLSNAIYRPPTGETAPNHSAFSVEEWRYIARVFTAWVVGGALVLSCIVTWQFHFALSQFGGEEYLGRIVALAAADLPASSVVLAAACNALVMVTERRTKVGRTEPVSRLPWSIVALMGLLTPIVLGLMLAISLAFTAMLVGVPSMDSLRGVLKHVQASHLLFPIPTVVVVGFVLAGSTRQIMRILSRFRGWLVPKCIVMMQLVGVLVFLVRVMMRVLFFAE